MFGKSNRLISFIWIILKSWFRFYFWNQHQNIKLNLLLPFFLNFFACPLILVRDWIIFRRKFRCRKFKQYQEIDLAQLIYWNRNVLMRDSICFVSGPAYSDQKGNFTRMLEGGQVHRWCSCVRTCVRYRETRLHRMLYSRRSQQCAISPQESWTVWK